jgi:hypothetical protein
MCDHSVAGDFPTAGIGPTAEVLRGELSGSDTATALDIQVKGYAPVLELCRCLIRRGIDPSTPLEVWRGPILSLRVRSIGAAAALEVRPSGNGRPVFVRQRRNVRRCKTKERHG